MHRVHFILTDVIHTKQDVKTYMLLYKFPGAAEINDYKLSGLEPQEFIFWSINFSLLLTTIFSFSRSVLAHLTHLFFHMQLRINLQTPC